MAASARSLTKLVSNRRVLAVALEYVPSAAYVIQDDGHIMYANELGEAELADPAMHGRLLRAIDGADDEFDVHATREPGQRLVFLVIANSCDAVESRTTAAASRWNLTARHREVLAFVMRGFTNLRIGLELGISERTVEAHVTAILSRAGCASRTELLASVLKRT